MIGQAVSRRIVLYSSLCSLCLCGATAGLGVMPSHLDVTLRGGPGSAGRPHRKPRQSQSLASAGATRAPLRTGPDRSEASAATRRRRLLRIAISGLASQTPAARYIVRRHDRRLKIDEQDQRQPIDSPSPAPSSGAMRWRHLRRARLSFLRWRIRIGHKALQPGSTGLTSNSQIRVNAPSLITSG